MLMQRSLHPIHSPRSCLYSQAQQSVIVERSVILTSASHFKLNEDFLVVVVLGDWGLGEREWKFFLTFLLFLICATIYVMLLCWVS